MARGAGAVADEEKVEAELKTDTTDLDKEFVEKTVTIRGTDYVLRELSQEEYDQCAAMATGKDGFDSILLLKFMLAKALVSPRLTAEQLKTKPFKVTNELRSVVNRMHWGDDEVDVDDEGNAPTGPGI